MEKKHFLGQVIISFIISQNNNIPRIKKSIQMLCDEFDGRFPTNDELLQMDLSNKKLYAFRIEEVNMKNDHKKLLKYIKKVLG